MNSEKSKAPKTRDYFAELFVAGTMGDAKWQIYFPKRDKGFDFIAVKRTPTGMIIRPMQVKGLYPTAAKKDYDAYPWRGELSRVHSDLAVAVVYFTPDPDAVAPAHVAYVPHSQLKRPKSGGYRFDGAKLHHHASARQNSTFLSCSYGPLIPSAMFRKRTFLAQG